MKILEKEKSYLKELMKDTVMSRLEGQIVRRLVLPLKYPKEFAPKEKPNKDKAVGNMPTIYI